MKSLTKAGQLQLQSFDAVEYAVAEWVAWFNTKRLLGPIGNIPPAEAEEAHWKSLEPQAIAE